MLTGKCAVVTGATSGIGLAIARSLAHAGVNVMINGLGTPAGITALCTELSTGTANVRHHPGDLREPDAAAALVSAAAAEFGAVDILVNNAGLQHVAPAAEFPPEKWDELQAVMLGAAFRGIRAALPGMQRRHWGRIVNLASVHGLVASPFKSAYVAAKHGLVGLTKTVALEVAETGITCNAICPGYVRTPLVENQIEAQAKAYGLPRDRVIREVLLAAQPTKRFVEVEEVAALALFLCSDAAKSITGASIPIDGGWTAR